MIATGWSKTWNTPEYYDDFPGFARDAALLRDTPDVRANGRVDLLQPVKIVLVELEIGVEPPDQLALQSDQAVLLVGDADDPAEMALGVDPTCDRLSPGKEDDVKTI